MAYDGSVAIDLELNAKNAKKTADDLEKHIKKIFEVSSGKKADAQFVQLQTQMQKSKVRADELRKTMKRLEETKVPTDEYKEISKSIEEAQHDLEKFESKRTDLLNKRAIIEERIAKGGSAKENKQLSNQIQKLNDQISLTDEKIKETSSTISYAKGELQDLVDTGQAFTLGDNTADYDKAVRSLGEVNNQMRVAVEKASNFSIVFDGVDYSIQKTTEDARNLTDILNKDTGRPAIENMDELNSRITQLEDQLSEVEQDLDGLGDVVDTADAEELDKTVTEIRGEISEMTQSLEDMILDMQELLNSGKLSEEEAGLVQERIEALSEDLKNAANDATEIAPALDEASGEAEEGEKHVVSMGKAIGKLPGMIGTGFVGVLKTAARAADQLATNLLKAAGAGVRSGFSKLLSLLKGVGHSAKSASSSMRGFAHSSLSIGSLLKAAIGISSLVVVFRKLKGAIKEGLTNLAQFNGGVNSTSVAMASLTSSLTYLKNAWGAAFSPILSYVTPVLTYLIDLIAMVANKIGMLFAALTGKTSFLAAKKTSVNGAGTGGGGSGGKTAEEKFEEAKKKAQAKYEKELAKVQEQRAKAAAKAEEQQAKAAERLAKAQEKANKQLGTYDELNVIITEDFEDLEDSYEIPEFEDPVLEEPDWEDFASGGAGAIEEMFEEVPIDPWIQELADKIKDIIEQIMNPLKQAWDEMGDYVISGFKTMAGEIGGLFKDIGRDFLKVWQQPETVNIFKNILGIVGDIEITIGNIAHNLREAWNFNDTGLHILEHIRDIFGILIEHVRNVTTYMKEWSAQLDFKPLLSSFDGLLEKLKQVADFLGSVFEDKWKTLILPFVEYLIEEAIPALNDTLGKIIDKVDWPLLQENIHKVFVAVEELAEEIVDGLITAFGDLGTEVAEFINSEEFTTFIDNVVAAIKSVKSEDIAKILTALGKAIIKIAEGVIKFINGIVGSEQFKSLLDKLIDWWNNTDADKLADSLVNIAKAILMFKFAKFAGSGFLNFMNLLNTLKGGGVGGALTPVAGGGAGGGLAGNLGKLAGGLAQVALVAADAYLAYELYNEIQLDNAVNTLPKATEATNGYTKELGFVASAFVDLHNAMCDVGDEWDKEVYVMSDLEKLNDMRLTIKGIDRDFQKWGVTNREIQEDLDRLYELAGYQGENLKNLTAEEVEEFDKLYVKVTTVHDGLEEWDPERNFNPLLEATGLADEKFQELIDDINKSGDTTGVVCQDIASKIKELANSADESSTNITGNNNKVIESFKKMADSVPKEEQGKEKGQSFSKGWLDSAVDKIKGAKDQFEGAGEDVAAGIMVGVQTGLTSIDAEGSFGSLLEAFKTFYGIASPSTVMEEQGQFLIEGLQLGIEEQWELLITLLEDELTKLQDFFKEHWTEIQEDVTESWDLIKTTVTERFNDTRSVINTTSQAVKNIIREMVTTVTSLFKKLSANIAAEVSNIKGSLDGLAESVTSMVSEISGAVDSLSDAASNIEGAIPNTVNAKLNIPRLAQGAVIPPHSQFLAVLGDQKSGMNVETPLKTMVQAFEMALDERGGSSNNQPIVLQLDGRTIAEVVWDEEDKRYKQRGMSGLAFI